MTAARTPLYDRHVAAGGRMVDFAGWDMPQQYTSVKAEQRAVRTGAGLFDVSHMGRFEVLAADPAAFLQAVVTNDVGALAPGRALYTLMCDGHGGVVDDLVVYHAGGETAAWPVVVNAGNRDKDMIWLCEQAPGGVEVADRSADTCLLALQGPRAAAVLPVSGLDLGRLPYFAIGTGRVAGVRCMIARTGYTGEDGFELFVPADRAVELWDLLVEAGAVPCGLACRDVCRLEAGLRLYGSDMDETVNPYEAGLGWTVKLAKGEFVGRAALERFKAAGPRRTLVGVKGRGRAIPRHGAAVLRGGRPIGLVTSGTYSFWLEAGIGFALIETGAAAPGDRVEIEGRAGAGEADVVATPFYRGSAGRAGV